MVVMVWAMQAASPCTDHMDRVNSPVSKHGPKTNPRWVVFGGVRPNRREGHRPKEEVTKASNRPFEVSLNFKGSDQQGVGWEVKKGECQFPEGCPRSYYCQTN